MLLSRLRQLQELAIRFGVVVLIHLILEPEKKEKKVVKRGQAQQLKFNRQISTKI